VVLLPLPNAPKPPEEKAPHPANRAAQAIREIHLQFFMVILWVIFKATLQSDVTR
jgi:hypothetical protein